MQSTAVVLLCTRGVGGCAGYYGTPQLPQKKVLWHPSVAIEEGTLGFLSCHRRRYYGTPQLPQSMTFFSLKEQFKMTYKGARSSASSDKKGQETTSHY